LRARGGADDPPPQKTGGGGGFFAGLLLGGTVFGALGLLFAPQISSALLRGKEALRTPRNESGEDGAGALEEQRESLNKKILDLNRAIDAFSAEARTNCTPHDRAGLPAPHCAARKAVSTYLISHSACSASFSRAG